MLAMARRVDNPADTAAIAAYGAEVEVILRRHVTTIEGYAGVVTTDRIAADMRSRAKRVDAALSVDWTQDTNAPELPLWDETDHTLVFAWCLDPLRTGPFALRFWHRFLDLLARIDAAAGAGESKRIEQIQTCVASEGFPASHGLDILPRYRDDEFDFGAGGGRPDVFVRAPHAENFEWALLVEAKTKLTTGEQPRQLARYFSYVESRWRAANNTVFVFLTESGRIPESAGVSRPRWIRVRWLEIARILEQLSRDSSVSNWERTFAAQFREAIRINVLNQPDIRELRNRRAHLGTLSCEIADRELNLQHRTICELDCDLTRRSGS